MEGPHRHTSNPSMMMMMMMMNDLLSPSSVRNSKYSFRGSAFLARRAFSSPLSSNIRTGTQQYKSGFVDGNIKTNQNNFIRNRPIQLKT